MGSVRRANPMVDQHKPNWHVSDTQRSCARAVRRAMSASSAASCLHMGFEGVSLRRQTPVGAYLVACVRHAAKLTVEGDGGRHFEPGIILRHARRDACLTAQGVVGLNNLDAMPNKTGGLKAAVAPGPPAPSPTLLRKRRRGPGHAGREDVP